MSGAALVAIGTIGGVVVSGLLGFWNARRQTKVDERSGQAILLEGYSKMVNDLREEVKFVRQEWGEDRATWASQEESMRRTIDKLESQVLELHKELAELKGRMAQKGETER